MIKYYIQVVYRPIGHVTSAGREFLNNRNNIIVCWYWRYLKKKSMLYADSRLRLLGGVHHVIRCIVMLMVKMMLLLVMVLLLVL
jgi:hypothetical protein